MTGHNRSAMVHLLAGLNGAGKTTYAMQLQAELPAVRFSLDEWMLRLHGLAYDDPRYPALAEGCQGLIWDTALQVLASGVDVVLDWAERAREHGYDAVLHYVRVSLETAIARAETRQVGGGVASHALDERAVRHLYEIFEEPAEDEPLKVRVVDAEKRRSQAIG